MEYILVSACLLGVACRYDGASKPCQAVLDLIDKKKINKNITEEIDSYEDAVLIPICPEQLGGLATPRVPSERCPEHFHNGIGNNRVISENGIDVTAQYKRGAEEAFRIAKLYHCKKAILKEKSPSCGHGKIYDGTFTRTLIDGDGVTAELFLKNGIEVIGEKSLSHKKRSEIGDGKI